MLLNIDLFEKKKHVKKIDGTVDVWHSIGENVIKTKK